MDEFTYDGKEKSEFVEWTETNFDEEITLELKRHLSSKYVMPTDVLRVFRLSSAAIMATHHSCLAGLSVELSNDRIIDFEVLICELLCRKVMGHLLEETILQHLTSGLEIISTFQLHLFTDNKSGVLVVEYRHCNPSSNATPGHIPTTEVFVTDDLASQAMSIGKESMAGHWCMQCSARPADSNLLTHVNCAI